MYDYSGQKIGKLLVLEKSSTKGKRKEILWLCECKCGKSLLVSSKNLKRSTRSCGCDKIKDITGQRNGSLVAIRFSHINRSAYWLFRCDCGVEFVARGCSVIGGHVNGCKSNCKKRIVPNSNNKDLNEYKIWCGIINRCTNPNIRSYRDYGGRGIKICDRWRTSFKNFYEDIGPKPSPKYTIDRIDPNGDYEPKNCRWSTRTVQSINQRIKKSNKSGIKGVILLPNGRWRATISIGKTRLSLGCFQTKEEAEISRKQAEKILYPKIFKEQTKISCKSTR